eukprot:TRINITY_DN7511_c0_g1_i3.p2 TRINITY_DN7511_c0_g1~~TRINITY_DN7511_c0_g1_i3.p2  ORF type:complete len:225 (+),score=66.43 TRINITY_DN7511_c0_g1_i3:172-846(+)
MRSLAQLLLLMLPAIAAGTVVPLTTATFKETVKDGLWLVEFMAPWCGHCQQLKPIYAEAAEQLTGKLGMAAVDATAEKELQQEFGVNSFPSIKLFKDGEFRKDYDGPRTLAGFEAFYEENKDLGDKPPSHVVELTAENFDSKTGESTLALVKFYAPWCGHCKALAPTWEAVAAELNREHLVAKVDCIAHPKLQRRFGVSGFPVIKLLKNGKTKGDYQGPRKKDE